MKHEESSFQGAKGVKIYYQIWKPDTSKPKGCVQIIHGLPEHSGRYMSVVNSLVSAGYTVYANDQRGHGKSEGKRAFVDCFSDFVEDMGIFRQIIREQEPAIPSFILGYSIGSFVAQLYVVSYSEDLRGLILAGSGTGSGLSANRLLIPLIKVVSKLIPRKTLDPRLGEHISRDPEVVKAYKEDPLVSKVITVRIGAEILNVVKQIYQNAPKIQLPCLFQSGSEDKIVIGVEALFDRFTVKDKTLKIYDGAYHDIYNELPNTRKIVLKDLINWIDEHL
ncbi:MAG: alpha/beta hydrolase [Candidatus Hermodarchaeota archaeon]